MNRKAARDFTARHSGGDPWLARVLLAHALVRESADAGFPAALALVREWAAAKSAGNPSFTYDLLADPRIDFETGVYRAKRWRAELDQRTRTRATKRIGADEANAPTAVSFANGLAWVWLKTDRARRLDAEATGHGFVLGPYASQRLVFSLRDGDGAPLAAAALWQDRVDELVVHANAPADGLKHEIAEGAALLSARSYLGTDPASPLADGVHAFAKFGVAVTAATAGGLLHAENGPAVKRADGRGEEWWRRGKRHRSNGPAVVTVGKTAEYWVDGRRHRLDGPAVEGEAHWEWWRDGVCQRDDGPAKRHWLQTAGPENHGYSQWMKDGRSHRVGGAAYEGDNGDRKWHENGVLHRLDGPAVELASGRREWRVAGVLHRVDGPALVSETGREEWWRHGKRHRADGPAVVPAGKSSDREFWVDGVERFDPFNDDWQALFEALYLAANARPGNRGRTKSEDDYLASQYAGTFAYLRRKFDKAGVRSWSPKAWKAVQDAVAAKITPVAEELEERRRRNRIVAAKCLRLSFVLASKDYDSVPAGERESLKRLLERTPEQAATDDGTPFRRLADRIAAPKVDPVQSDSPVAFLHLWEKTDARGKKTQVASVGRAPLDRLRADEAPVFATLQTEDGGTLDLRRIDGVPFRPVVLPDCWRPATEGEFRKHAAEGAAWRDSPFTGRAPNDLSCVAVADAVPSRPTRDDEAETALAERDCRLRAGRLVVVDGTVYRRTEEPTVHIVATETFDLNCGSMWTGMILRESKFATKAWDRRHRLAWRLGEDLAMTDTQATIACPGDSYAVWEDTWTNAPRFAHRGPVKLKECVSTPGLAFGLHAAHTAAAVLAAWAKRCGDIVLEAEAATPPASAVTAGAPLAEAVRPMLEAVEFHGGKLRGGSIGLAVALAKARGALDRGDVDAFEAAATEIEETACLLDLAKTKRDESPVVALLAALAITVRKEAAEMRLEAEERDSLSGLGFG